VSTGFVGFTRFIIPIISLPCAAAAALDSPSDRVALRPMPV